MASNTNVREMIAKNNAKKGGFSDKIVPIILGIIAAIYFNNYRYIIYINH